MLNVNFKSMDCDNNIMPIIGLGTTIFGYVVKGNYNGPSFKFVFCDESGSPVSYKLENDLILSIQPHYYSASVSDETKRVIIIRPDYSLYTIGGYYHSKTYILELTPIGNSGLFITSKSLIDEDKFGCKPHLFHPISYLCLSDSPLLINIPQKEINRMYYLFSILSFHFVVDLRNVINENPDDLTYLLLDNDGNTIYTWDNNKHIKSIWRREDGTFTIFSVSDCYKECYDYDNRELYDISNYRNLNIICIHESYENLTFEDYKTEIDTANKSNLKNLYSAVFGEALPTDDSLQKEEYVDWRKRKSITDRTFVLKSDYVQSLNYNSHYSGNTFNGGYSGLFCDNNYFIVKHDCGFISFDKSSLLSINDFSNLVTIDKWNYDDYEYVPIISGCKYGNGMIGFQLMKKYVGWTPPEEANSHYDKYIGEYRLHDIYGNCIGELHGNLLASPINGIGIHQFYGVVDNADFSIIIPPIYKEIISLDH